MILTCPECSTRYHVDPATLGPGGRRVRCANCGRRWLARPPADAPTVVELTPAPMGAPPLGPIPLGAPPRKRALAAPEDGRSNGSASLVGWLVGVLVVLLLASAIIGRNEIVAGFPASAALYQKLGLPVTVQLGLQFENVVSERLDERGVSILVVEGEIVNVSEQAREVPPVRVSLLDDAGRPLQYELFEAGAPLLQAGGKTSFSGRLVNPAKQARNFSVTFDLGA